jgi:hypothetical protein
LIKDDRRGKYFHSLSYEEGFDYRELESTLLKRDVKENLAIFDRFVFGDYPTDDQVKELHDYLDEAINEHYKRIAYKEKDAVSVSELRKRHSQALGKNKPRKKK